MSTSDTQPTPSDSSEAVQLPRQWRRWAAMVYDSMLLVAVGLSYGALATGLNVLIKGAPEERTAIEWGAWEPLVFLGLLASLMGFYYFFWGRSGQTLGMRAWRLKLVDARSHRLASPGQRIGRAMLAPLSFALFGLGYFWAWFDRDAHTLHGRLTGTRVVLVPKGR